jgi:hypothetical protein
MKTAEKVKEIEKVVLYNPRNKHFDECAAFIWCDCRGENVPPAGLNDVSHYIIYSWIFEKNEKAKCKYCGKIVEMFMPWALPENLKQEYLKKPYLADRSTE